MFAAVLHVHIPKGDFPIPFVLCTDHLAASVAVKGPAENPLCSNSTLGQLDMHRLHTSGRSLHLICIGHQWCKEANVLV